MLYNKPTYFDQFVLFETPIFSERNRVEPEIGNLPIPFNMDVDRFPLIGTEEERTIGTLPKNSRQRFEHQLYTAIQDYTTSRAARFVLVNGAPA